jgi:hypothetical protein
VVRQRLKRQAISPKLRALYGKGEMNLDQLYAFAIAEDHKRQERLWKITALQPQPRGAALAHYFFASRIGEQRGQRMAARVADRLCRIGHGELRFRAFSSTPRLRHRTQANASQLQL